MQFIVRCEATVDEYIAGDLQRVVGKPSLCPHCRRRRCLRALGYYGRGIGSSDSGRILTVLVRRFRCRLLGRTVSMLPSFAHPYRLVSTVFIDRYFSGRRGGIEMQWWAPLLQRYWRRFQYWLPSLLDSLDAVAGLSPPIRNHVAAWKILRREMGAAPLMTRRLVSRYRVTVLGRYRCHEPAAEVPDF